MFRLVPCKPLLAMLPLPWTFQGTMKVRFMAQSNARQPLQNQTRKRHFSTQLLSPGNSARNGLTVETLPGKRKRTLLLEKGKKRRRRVIEAEVK